MDVERIITELPGGLIFDSRVTREDLQRLHDEMRDWDRKELAVCNDDIRAGWKGMKFEERIMAKVETKGGELIGVWETIPLTEEIAPGFANWGWITTKAADRHALAYCQGGGKTVELWWRLERPETKVALVETIQGHRQAERFLEEIIRAELLERDHVFYGIPHNVYCFTKPGEEIEVYRKSEPRKEARQWAGRA